MCTCYSITRWFLYLSGPRFRLYQSLEAPSVMCVSIILKFKTTIKYYSRKPKGGTRIWKKFNGERDIENSHAQRYVCQGQTWLTNQGSRSMNGSNFCDASTQISPYKGSESQTIGITNDIVYFDLYPAGEHFEPPPYISGTECTRRRIVTSNLWPNGNACVVDSVTSHGRDLKSTNTNLELEYWKSLLLL